MKNILIIEDDITLSLMLKTWLTKKGFVVRSALRISEAKKAVAEEIPDLVLSDLRLPDDSGISFLKWMKESHPEVVFIMMTGYADIQTAVESIKSGAFDYIAKPLNPDELLKKIELVSAQKALEKNTPTKKVSSQAEFIRGKSIEYKQLYDYIDLVAPTKLAVLIRGNSGVGKEHVARLIHEKSDRSKKAFVALDCGVLGRELAASELFGHVKGAFTGAIMNKNGSFLEANGGTLFLDEIGNLSMDIQVQLLRALQEKCIKPVGSNKEIEVDVRIISATNEDIEEVLSKGLFRMDLYHRINEFLLYIPTLKECKDDISLFAHYFLEISNQQLNKKIIGFKPETLNLLRNYSWPGNIRELKNIISRIVLIAPGAYITQDLLPENIRNDNSMAKDLSLKNFNEKERIEEALKFTNNNKSKAASILSIDRKTLYHKIKLYNIEI
ncbi:transcriptional regulatory protein ZraR [Bacteroidales bacterium]|nr:transcriptional regulatory protein ZraR [Bacteroidales bacterium]